MRAIIETMRKEKVDSQIPSQPKADYPEDDGDSGSALIKTERIRKQDPTIKLEYVSSPISDLYDDDPVDHKSTAKDLGHEHLDQMSESESSAEPKRPAHVSSGNSISRNRQASHTPPRGEQKKPDSQISPHPTTKFTTHFSENHGTRGSLQPS